MKHTKYAAPPGGGKRPKVKDWVQSMPPSKNMGVFGKSAKSAPKAGAVFKEAYKTNAKARA